MSMRLVEDTSDDTYVLDILDITLTPALPWLGRQVRWEMSGRLKETVDLTRVTCNVIMKFGPVKMLDRSYRLPDLLARIGARLPGDPRLLGRAVAADVDASDSRDGAGGPAPDPAARTDGKREELPRPGHPCGLQLQVPSGRGDLRRQLARAAQHTPPLTVGPACPSRDGQAGPGPESVVQRRRTRPARGR
ncbi:hypothetical protein ACQ4WX_16315 [Streptomyces lasalocidi]